MKVLIERLYVYKNVMQFQIDFGPIVKIGKKESYAQGAKSHIIF